MIAPWWVQVALCATTVPPSRARMRSPRGEETISPPSAGMSATAATTVPAGVGSAVGVGAAVDGGTREVVAAVVDSALDDVRSGADGDGALEELLGDVVDRLLDVAAEDVAD